MKFDQIVSVHRRYSTHLKHIFLNIYLIIDSVEIAVCCKWVHGTVQVVTNFENVMRSVMSAKQQIYVVFVRVKLSVYCVTCKKPHVKVVVQRRRAVINHVADFVLKMKIKFLHESHADTIFVVSVRIRNARHAHHFLQKRRKYVQFMREKLWEQRNNKNYITVITNLIVPPPSYRLIFL